MRSVLGLNRFFILALVVVAATNLFVFYKVVSNRLGGELQTIVLTERELELSRAQDENSRLSLRLSWRVLSENNFNNHSVWSPQWLDRQKLAALGFTRPQDLAGKKRPIEEKEVYVVLEYNGSAYAEAMRWLKQLRLHDSRLYAVDAGLDIAALRQRYADGSKYLIVNGRISPRLDTAASQEFSGGRLVLSINNINIAQEQREFLDTLTPKKWNEDSPPRYRVNVAYGGELMPWIESVEPLAESLH